LVFSILDRKLASVMPETLQRQVRLLRDAKNGKELFDSNVLNRQHEHVG